MPGLEWLTERPVAHRGLHGLDPGCVENSISAVRAAMAAGYAIEVDIQQTRDGKAVVFHDFTLDRLTDETGPVLGRSLAELENITLSGCDDPIMSLSTLLRLVDGKVPLIVEMKSAEAGEPTLAQVLARETDGYHGRIAGMSFDPGLVNALRLARPFMTRGLISYRYDNAEAEHLPVATRLKRRFLAPIAQCSPHYIAYDCRALPALAPWVARRMLGMPLLSWTVRDEVEQARLAPHVDQIIFEGFRADGGSGM